MNNTPQLPIDKIFDENNTDNITLYNELGDPVEFEQIALVPLDGQVYVILKPVIPMEGMGEDEALVFLIAVNENGEEYLELCVEDHIIDRVFDDYNALLDDLTD